jgi:hypothetical protein
LFYFKERVKVIWKYVDFGLPVDIWRGVVVDHDLR